MSIQNVIARAFRPKQSHYRTVNEIASLHCVTFAMTNQNTMIRLLHPDEKSGFAMTALYINTK